MPSGSSPLQFPSYLLALPFRRRRRSSDTTNSPSAPSSATTTPDTSPSTSPRAPTYLSGHASYLRCTRCLADLCSTSQIISKGFTGRHGRAYLVAPPATIPSPGPDGRRSVGKHVAKLPNTNVHKATPRQLVTGHHTVCDISCAGCGAVLGWKYIAAEDEAQRYKVGKCILETSRVCKSVCWEGEAAEAGMEERERMGGFGFGRRRDGEGEVEFDSQDEDECDDLFSGAWSPALATRRRRARLAAAGEEGRDGI